MTSQITMTSFPQSAQTNKQGSTFY